MKNDKNGRRQRRARVLGVAIGAVLCAAATGACAADAGEGVGQGPRFAIDSYAVEGNSILPAAQVQALTAPYVGADRGFDDVRRAVDALQQAYRRRGFNLVVVQLPEQELDRGVVRVKVIEPRIRRVQVQGNRIFSTTNVRASLPALQEGAVPDIAAISASLKVANTNPAKQTALDLQSAGTPDAVDATVRVVDEKPWRVGLTADNTGTASTGRTRLGVLYQNANLWGRDHVGSLQYTTSAEHPSKVSVYSVGYHVPLYALGDSLDLYASHSNVDAGSVTAGVLELLVSGKGSVAGARYNHALPQWGELVSTLTAGADWRAYRESIDLHGFQLGGDVTVHPLSLGYAGQLPLWSGLLAVQVTGVQNIPGGSNGGDADFERQRAGARANYRLLRYGAAYTMRMPRDWVVRLQFAGQSTGAALVPGEQFGAGGAASVRGFREREVTGDRGAFASAQLETPNWCAPGTAVVQCHAVAFVEGASLARNNALAGEAQRTSVASAGVGLRVAVDRNVALQADYGRVLHGTSATPAGSSRVHVALSISY